MTYDGTDQSAVIIRGAGKIIGCLIAQSCGEGERGRNEAAGSYDRRSSSKNRSRWEGRGQSVARFHRLLIYALAALYAAEKEGKKERISYRCSY